MTEEADPLVVVVDDDVSIRESMEALLRSVGLPVRTHGSVQDFLRQGLPAGPACLVLDVRLPGQSGLDLQDELVRARVPVPIVFITGHGDVPMSVRAMKGGAFEFLSKPFRDQEMLDAIHQALERDRIRWRSQGHTIQLQQKFNDLTPREKEVLTHVVKGRLNKQIANDMGVSEITVKVHRGQVMRKMCARSLPDLVRMADRLGLSPEA